MKQSARLQQRATAVAKFRDEYIALLNMTRQVPRPKTMTMSMLVAISGLESDFKRQHLVVSRAAGRAHAAAGRYCGRVNFQQFGQSRSFDPISSWAFSFEDPQQLTPESIVSACESTIGVIEAKVEDARATERTLAGRVASFVGFPARVRAAVSEEHPQLGGAAFKAGVVGQVVVGVLVTVAAALIIAGLTLLWRAAM